MIKDIRYALRSLARRPGFTAVAVITLALGIGANTAIFSVVYGVLLLPLDYPAPEQLVSLRESHLKQPDAQVAPGNFLEWQRQNTVFSNLAAYRTVSYNLTGDGDPERLLAGRVTSNLFKTLGVQPILGREFLSEEDQPGREKVVIVGEGVWQRRFGSQPNIIGKTLKLSGEDFTVVGVMPASFRLPDQHERELWTPIAFKDIERTLHHARYFEAIGRLNSGVSLDQARAEMTAIAARLAQAHANANEGWTINVAPALDFAVGSARRILWMLFGAVGLLLLIACANVTNLLLARAATRQKEIAIRVALGAGRLRIVRQLTTESLLLALLGAMAGWPIAVWGLKALLAIAPADLPRLAAVTIDNRALLFTFGITLLTGLIFSVAPAFQLANADANQTLKDGGSEGNRGVAGQRIGSLLIAVEVALAVVLLVGSGLLLRTIWQLQHIDPGFDDRNALAVTLQLSEKKYADGKQVAQFSQQLVEQVSTLPGLEAAGITRILPIAHDMSIGFHVEGRPRPPDNQLPQTNYSAVSGGYFKAMGIPLLAGRTFSDREASRVAIISSEMAQREFPGENPIGRRIDIATGPETFREIVGVVGDVNQKGLTAGRSPHVYEPFIQAPAPFMTLIVRSSGDPSPLVPAIRTKVIGLDHELPLQRVVTLDRMISNSIRQQRFASAVLSVFAAVALVLALAGLYGVISYSVAQRTRELGIRMALGAQVGDVLRLVLRQGMTFVVLGEIAGIGVAYALSGLIQSLLFGVTATDKLTFITVAVALFLVALVACYVPARRATKVDPLLALRN
jgi:putative ABC transport system permease protein